ncbi:hypothetical protein BpHYR1_040004 [Brachionus plicatilis]|uniref:Homeobox domain-containing protein n=1 Tax=Brachionus plicatilis TaxID=10195 RepID=A0A3M7RFY4_BRAPC|nr:hypothetical protein BpHYR1_040004 [Brachionus plicatilis]
MDKKLFYKNYEIYRKSWLNENLENLYPSLESKIILSNKTNLTLKKINHWFVWKRTQLKKRNALRKSMPRRKKLPNGSPIKDMRKIDQKVFSRFCLAYLWWHEPSHYLRVNMTGKVMNMLKADKKCQASW